MLYVSGNGTLRIEISNVINNDKTNLIDLNIIKLIVKHCMLYQPGTTRAGGP